MGRIGRLPDDLANQIAAGEVVERPASVVKELIENAIDAGARRVSVTVEFGGKKLIRVEDDGAGMDGDDARLCVERHATSKIRCADDLAAIHTLGFRGEALPSIASVAHFRLRTRLRGAPSGTEVRVSAGASVAAREVGAPEGTLIEVGELFFNLPARRKFLKSDAAESAQVSRTTTQMALCYPEVGFTLVSAGRTVLQCPPVGSLEDRLYQVYGERRDLVEVHRETATMRIRGYIAALAESGPTRGPQHVFINRRFVKDRTIAHAIFDAYSTASNRERSPELHLFIEMPPDQVDVNVHPTKAEVRFRDQSVVHSLVRRAVGDALGHSTVPELALAAGSAALSPEPGARSLPGILSQLTAVSAVGGQGPATDTDSLAVAARDSGAGASPVDHATLALRPLLPLGQFRNTFIIATDDESIYLIDQHVAHERVLFERVVERLTRGTLPSQRLLMPLLIDLSAAAREALAARQEALAAAGFEIAEFGGDTLRISAVPALLSPDACDTAIRALAQDLDGLDRGVDIRDALQRIAATMACHAAVKANDVLTPEKMRHILAELRATAYSTVCPHGRPVMLRLTRREIEKNFERT